MDSTSLSLDAKLPALRGDLQLIEGARQTGGGASWLIFDPLRHRYFQIDETKFQLLSRWGKGTPGAILEDEKVSDADLGDIEALIRFLFTNSLTQDPPANDFRNFAVQAEAGKQSFLASIVHNYLFVRIPLVRPHAFLKRTIGLTDIFFTRQWWTFVALIGLVGLFLSLRQWDQFTATFMHFFNLKGLALYFVALIFVKIAHELGHAYAATRYGCRVSTMGVAFLVMFPVLFTDTTDGWKLTERRKRLVIDAAGVAVELTIAVFATLLWAFLPEGPWRSATFIIATTSWIMSLAVNLNPLMRFDGYHFFADATGVQNLQARSFALGRWALREFLFGWNDPAPEAMSRSRRRGLIAFAWATWVYRFFLFLGIALLVHAIFFKALGIILFVIEIGWFIALPIFNEMREWWARREEIRLTRGNKLKLTGFCALVLLALVPWQSTIRVPAILEAEQHAVLYPDQPAIVTTIHVQAGDEVAVGDLLVEMRAPALEYEMRQTVRRTNLLRARLARIVADAADLEQKVVLQQELAKEQNHLTGLEEQISALNLTAPFSGVVTDIHPAIHEGRHVSRTDELASVISSEGTRIRGYVSAEDVERLSNSGEVIFVSDTRETPKVTGTLKTVSGANAEVISVPALASKYGGRIAVSEANESLEPLQTWYGVLAEIPEDMPPPEQVLRGEMRVKGKAESFGSKVWRRAMRVFIRETSI